MQRGAAFSMTEPDQTSFPFEAHFLRRVVAQFNGVAKTAYDSWTKPYFDAKELKMTDRLRFTES
jgi:hypothetical protein